MGEVQVLRGTVVGLRVYDVADRFDLKAVEGLMEGRAKGRLHLAPNGGPAVDIREPPVTLVLGTRAVRLGAEQYSAEVYARVWDYGVVSVQFHLPIPSGTPWSRLVTLAAQAEDDNDLDEVSLVQIAEVSRELEPAAEGLHPVRGVEDYIVYLLDELAGVNHKMGYRGTVNCLLNFGEGRRYQPEGRAGAIGYLVGGLHQGLACMFHMMNNARIGVGLGAVALGYTGYLHALDYARNRPQGRPLGAEGKDPTSAQTKIINHADVRRMLLAQKAYVEGGLAFNLYCARLVDEAEVCADATALADLNLLLDILTPIAKSWPSQWCLAANDLAIQIHGGYGYTREYKVEQFYRDNRLNPIHEGTHGIQALDLLGRKVVMHDGAAFRLYAARVEASIARIIASAAGDFIPIRLRLPGVSAPSAPQ